MKLVITVEGDTCADLILGLRVIGERADRELKNSECEEIDKNGKEGTVGEFKAAGKMTVTGDCPVCGKSAEVEKKE